jgi:protein SCO1/2
VIRPAPAVAHPGSSGDRAPAAAAAARAPAPDEDIPPPPPTYRAGGVTVDERVGGRIPLDTRFRTHDGTLTTLGELLTGGLPAILTFNYSDCPMLCNLQLNGLSAVLPAIGERLDGKLFKLGGQFRIVTIDLEPNDSLAKLNKMRDRYIERLPEAQRAAARAGWTYLVAATPGDSAAIRRVAESVGFSYTYLADRAEYAHPAALIFLSVKGTVTRYVYGIEFDPQIMRESIIKAGTSEPATAVGFMNRCYHFDPDANSHTRAGVMALRIGAAGFVVLLLSGLGMMHFIRRSSSAGKPAGATRSE